MRRLIIALTAASISFVGAGTSYGQTFARVAAWNQQGVRFDDSGVHKINKPAELRTAIAAIDPDVIALSEVNSRESLDEIVATPFTNGATYKIDMENGQQVPQMIAVLFKDSPDISVGNRREIPGSDEGQPDRLRKAWAFDVKIRNFDFLLIAVHLKSGRGTEERETRTCQTRAISRFIEVHTAATGEKDVLVVGDYNMVPTQDQRNFVNLSPGPQNNEFLKFISSTLRGPSHIGECTSPSNFTGNLLDGFAISRIHTTEWTGYIRIQQLQALLPSMFCSKYKATISDHLPLVARFRVNGADDD
jgi:endonuclease/exonuclease/phosphatase family metal-dependent hydrolase